MFKDQYVTYVKPTDLAININTY